MNPELLPRLLLLDLDGTLLRSDGSVSDGTLSALNACRQRGIRLVIATARFWFKAEKYIRLLQPDEAILADGTQIFCGEKLMDGLPLEPRQRDGLISDLMEDSKARDFIVCTGRRLLLSVPGVHEPWRETGDFTRPLPSPVYKIAAVLDSLEQAQALAARHGCRLHTYHGEQLYGFTHPAAGKLQAARALGSMLGIGLDDMMAFGDDQNDLDLLTHCGRGIAMGNAAPSIREAASDVTATNDDDGVARYLTRMLERI